MKAGWWAHRRNPEDHGLHWPYIPLCYPHPNHLFFEDIDISCLAQDTKQKSQDCFYKSSYRVFELPKLW